MHIPHLYQAANLHPDLELVLSSEVSKHLKVLRWSAAEAFRIFNGTGGEYAAKIIHAENKKLVVKIGKFFPENNLPSLEIHLGQGVSRGEKMDYTIQKAVELGVTQITPLLTEYCNVKLPPERWEKKLQHWRAVAIAACEQSGRNILPDIVEPQTFSQWSQQLNTDWKLLLDPNGKQQLHDLKNKPKSIGLLIGSEGGFAESEVKTAFNNGFTGLKMGPRILRTETAAVAAIAVIQSFFGDMG